MCIIFETKVGYLIVLLSKGWLLVSNNLSLTDGRVPRDSPKFLYRSLRRMPRGHRHLTPLNQGLILDSPGKSAPDAASTD